MEPEGLSSHSKEPSTYPNPEPDRFSLAPPQPLEDPF